MPALVLIGYWALFNAATFIALQYLPGALSTQCLISLLPVALRSLAHGLYCCSARTQHAELSAAGLRK
jgi:hypothetical protein